MFINKKILILLVLINIATMGFLFKNVQETKWLNKVTENSIMNRIESISSEIERFDKERPNVRISYVREECSTLLANLETYRWLERRGNSGELEYLFLKFRRVIDKNDAIIGTDITDEMMETLNLINHYIEEFQQCEGKNLKEKLKKFNEIVANDGTYFDLRR